MTAPPLLRVEGLATTFPSELGPVRAVDGVSFEVLPGERIGVVGESGSGKSVTALSVMGLVPSPPATVSGRVFFRGEDVLQMSPKQRRAVRGAGMSMIFQNPLSCLNPTMRMGDQIAEAILAHEDLPKRVARERAVDLLGRVGIPSPARNADEYPHRFSGGMRQRVMVALALSCRPDLLLADEPTTALDVTIQAQIVELLLSLCEEQGTAVIFITHDLGILAGFAERILVMYAGRIVEKGDVDTIYYRATHPYTWGLMTSLTRMDESRRDRLRPIEGAPPSAIFVPPGCAFHPRCPYAQEVCVSDVPELIVRPADDHPSACHFAGTLAAPTLLKERYG
ncbi:MAG: ABC transporter ATP-binding protein [Actinomycetota bacterium]